MPIFNKHNIGGTILERAKSVQLQPKIKSNGISDEEMILAIAWARDEVTLTQVKGALGIRRDSAALVRLSRWLREAVRHGALN